MAAMQAMTSAQEMITESQAAQDLLGSPLTLGQPVQQSVSADEQAAGMFAMAYSVSGPNGSGQVIAKFKMTSYTQFDVDSIILTTDDGKEVDLLNADDLNIKIEDPDE